ncbi:MAG: hypothetical protein OEW39_00755 [Deltaproteobacteria bacterium]|nr:hypothetical protein [Deltaproteobacteria bacterium]
MLRKSALIVLAVVLLLGGGIYWLGASGMVEALAERGLTRLFKSDVRIDDLGVSLLKMQGDMRGLNIARAQGGPPVVNSGPAIFRLEGMPLFAGKLVIDEMSLKNLALAPKGPKEELPDPKAAKSAPEAKDRQDPPEDTTKKWKESARTLGGKLPAFNPALLAGETGVSEDLLRGEPASLKAYDEAARIAKERKEGFQAEVGKARLSERARKLKADSATLKTVNYKNPKEAQAAVATLQSLSKDLKTLQSDAEQLQTQGSQGLQEAQTAFQTAEELRKKDLEEVRGLIALKGMDKKEIGRVLFGRAVLSRFDEVMGYIAQGRSVLGRVEQKDPPPKRGMGRTILFPLTSPVLPGFLVRKAALSGALIGETGETDFLYDANLQGLTTSPTLYGKPTTFQANLRKEANGKAWKVDALMDYRAKPLDEVTITGTGMSLGEVKLAPAGKSGPLPASFRSPNANMTMALRLEQDVLAAKMRLEAKDLVFRFEEGEKASTTLAKELKSFFSGIQALSLEASLRGPMDHLDFDVSTDLDDKFSQRLRDMAGKKMKDAQERARAKVHAVTEAKRAQALKIVNEGRETLQKGAETIRNEIKSAQSELSARLADSKTSVKEDLKQDLKDKAKKLLKK